MAATNRNGSKEELEKLKEKAGTELEATSKSKENAKNSPLKSFKATVDRMKGEIEAALPQHLKANSDRYARNTVTLFSQNPSLQLCRPVTILGAMMTATALGLDLSPQLGQAYIIPYQNSKYMNGKWEKVWEAQFQFGYKGLVALAHRSDKIAYIAAHPVYEKDVFDYSYGTKEYRVLKHKPSPLPKKEDLENKDDNHRGDIKFYYAIAELTNGGENFLVWPRVDVISHAKKFSKSYYKWDKSGNRTVNSNSPWVKDEISMAQKTLLIQLCRYLPVSVELGKAIAQDETTRDDLSLLEREKDIIDITPSDSPSE